MTQGNIDEFTWSLAGEAVLRPNLEKLASEDLARVEVDPTNPLGETYEMSDGDREIMARPAYAARMQRLMQEAYRRGVDDTLVPPAHGNWLAKHVPNALVVRMSGDHLELVNRAEELLRWLVDGVAAHDAAGGTS